MEYLHIIALSQIKLTTEQFSSKVIVILSIKKSNHVVINNTEYGKTFNLVTKYHNTLMKHNILMNAKQIS